jgi:hypothetical protein
MYEVMRRLHSRDTASTGITVDPDGAMLGLDCIFVRRTADGYRCVSHGEAGALQEFLFGDDMEPGWFFEQCRHITKALDNQEIALAQIFGLRIPLDGLDRERLRRLALASPFIKANFNPDEPRIPAGHPGGGEWSTGDAVEAPAPAPSTGENGGAASPEPGGRVAPLLIPTQVTIPWDVPAEIPWEIPGAPSEITPLPFDFPGAERSRPPFPRNPFPRDPECAEEWAAAYDYCDRMEKEGKFRPGYSGPGKDYQSCLLGQVSERCGGNPTA